jgi:hypothetical protein
MLLRFGRSLTVYLVLVSVHLAALYLIVDTLDPSWLLTRGYISDLTATPQAKQLARTLLDYSSQIRSMF